MRVRKPKNGGIPSRERASCFSREDGLIQAVVTTTRVSRSSGVQRWTWGASLALKPRRWNFDDG